MLRKGSKNGQTNNRIPDDVLSKARGRVLALPIGDSIRQKTITAKDTHIKVSLRTSDTSERKRRQPAVNEYLEGWWAEAQGR